MSITAAQHSMLKSSSAVEKVSGLYSKRQFVCGRRAALSRSCFAPSIAIALISGISMPKTMRRHAGETAL
jgi:hypothetical protein